MRRIGWAGAAALAAIISLPAAAQDKARIEWKVLHSPAMEGNLEGNSADRGAYVVTPPGYDEHPDKRYPVVYFLHGYWATPQMYQEGMKFDAAVQAAAEAGNELIMVIPDGSSRLKGGFYSSSPTVGDYERFVARDLVQWVDASYRTLPERASRGLAGHSMGGYGTIRLAMKYPDTFSSIYMMSACCLDPMQMTPEIARRIEGMGEDDIAKAQFGDLAPVSTLATWSPDPSDDGILHVYTGLKEDGTIDTLVNQRLAANAPIVLVPQYLPALKALDAFAMDIGDKDFLIEGNRLFRQELDRFGVNYEFELYEGDHGNRIADRIREEVLPFFGKHLSGQNNVNKEGN
ncbi:alpha/beta hydrolase [Altererythrobacter sp. B11]|uniref:alpha/beta hydrolase n=1 Tax=Altererythrobacter sp. B11 TaxID=2060312 RepID=UPI001E5A36E6|nr:alpha/beta fold hydrolase [Altererythrobacter sp. B11]